MNVDLFKHHCCGCGECYSVCPVNAIKMELNSQCFYYPKVDLNKCIDCSKCVKHCSFNDEDMSSKSNKVLQSFALKHTNEEIRAKSRSGGVFTALSDVVLERGGVVYGCKLQNLDKPIQ